MPLHAKILVYQMLLEVTGLSKRFGGVTALADVTFGVDAGEVLGLIGPNGAGKSTLFDCVAGLLPCDSGKISAGGRPVGAGRDHRSCFMFRMESPVAGAIGAMGVGLRDGLLRRLIRDAGRSD
jgi:ABC-type branched-subunit amino acid transport system ATPase component